MGFFCNRSDLGTGFVAAHGLFHEFHARFVSSPILHKKRGISYSNAAIQEPYHFGTH